MTNFISPSRILELQNDKGAVVLDASYSPDAFTRFLAGRIAGAQFFDIDNVADPAAEFAHTLPSAELFAQKVGALGISNETPVIIYAQNGIAMAAARAWWMFKAFGHSEVYVLNGGLNAWLEEGYPLAGDMPATPETKTYKAEAASHFVSTADILATLNKENAPIILDARAQQRFDAGHIPTSHCVPFMALLDQHGFMLPADTLAEAFRLPKETPIITSCGSGVTACVIALALAEIGYENVSVYDGSWTEWTSGSANLPIDTV